MVPRVTPHARKTRAGADDKPPREGWARIAAGLIVIRGRRTLNFTRRWHSPQTAAKLMMPTPAVGRRRGRTSCDHPTRRSSAACYNGSGRTEGLFFALRWLPRRRGWCRPRSMASLGLRNLREPCLPERIARQLALGDHVLDLLRPTHACHRFVVHERSGLTYPGSLGRV